MIISINKDSFIYSKKSEHTDSLILKQAKYKLAHLGDTESQTSKAKTKILKIWKRLLFKTQ